MSVDTQWQRAISYVTDVLQKGDRLLAQHLAGMLRDGVVQRAMKRSQTQPIPTCLGRRLSGKLRKLAGLPPRLKMRLVCLQVEVLAPLVNCDASQGEGPADSDGDGEDEVVGNKLAFEAELADALSSFALNVDLSVKAPSAHHAAQFENPMLAVLLARAADMTNRLAKLSIADITSWNFGYFKWDKSAPKFVKDIDGRVVKLCISDEMFADMTDLRLSENWSTSAKLVSEATGYSENLHTLLQVQHKASFPDPLKEFEYVEATESYKDMLTTEMIDVLAAPKAKGKAKAAARVVPQVPKVQRPKKKARGVPK